MSIALGCRSLPRAQPDGVLFTYSSSRKGNPALLRASQAFLELFHAPYQTNASKFTDSPAPNSLAVSLSNPLSYADRLRIRLPGDSKFALGPHIDGGGVEKWECPSFRGVFKSILQESEWEKHDAWSLGTGAERISAQTDMYGGGGQCSVFRPWQGWLSLSETRANEGTLRVLPNLKEVSAYIMLRPFFKPKSDAGAPTESNSASKDYLSAENWEVSLDGSQVRVEVRSLKSRLTKVFSSLFFIDTLFPLLPLAVRYFFFKLPRLFSWPQPRAIYRHSSPFTSRSIDDLNLQGQPRRRRFLAMWLVSTIQHTSTLSLLARLGAQSNLSLLSSHFFTDVVHSVEASHKGLGDSSVMYIPAIPLTENNFNYVLSQRESFKNGTPPYDFPGGVGEKDFVGRAQPDDVPQGLARRSMVLEKFEIKEGMPEAEKRLLEACNALI